MAASPQDQHWITYVIRNAAGKHALQSLIAMTSLPVSFYSTALIGFFLGFAFGVGCALAVMYSIYMGGYRAAVRDSLLASPPPRLVAAQAKALAAQPSPKP